MHLLIAEDNSTNAKVLANLLARMNHTSEWAVNGREVVDKARQSGPYDAILMDLQMPEMDGLEAARVLVAELSPCPPIIACTANSFQSDRIAAAEAGMVGFVAKPVTERALIAALGGLDEHVDSNANDDYAWDQFDMVMGNRDEDLLEIFDDFCAMTPNTFIEIERAVQNGNWSSVADQAHQLRGTLRTFGIEALSQKILSVERSALAGAVVMDGSWSERLIKEFKVAEKRLRQRLVE